MYEETGISQHQYTIKNNIPPSKETFTGTDNRLYGHLYYVAEVKDPEMHVSVDEKNIVQMREVSQVKWASFLDIKKLFRDYNIEKLEMIQKLDTFLNDHFRFLEGSYEKDEILSNVEML
jgi:hypothetical protein